uniref:Secreted protein n=1 Tax=Trichuris muris TaxID=70415 RepID=A0A5S6QSG9_TRIMR
MRLSRRLRSTSALTNAAACTGQGKHPVVCQLSCFVRAVDAMTTLRCSQTCSNVSAGRSMAMTYSDDGTGQFQKVRSTQHLVRLIVSLEISTTNSTEKFPVS